ncbi:mandelate racemase/muconate lactonizing enzyme family protein [Enterococcus massiliensis]|uniref:mandelate racemase/muconate lactonizing enzyme family protein n=1 Tax=Enterococcus massiliensis TaxID=1640685 RepID=UPI00065E1E6B|nr:mandelate racemase/muconate lactonizing enzyme family protein [Enterococcus massiliensis]
MRITKIETIPIKHYLFVKVYTDEGIVGLGEAGNWGFLDATRGAIEKLADFLIGEDPRKIEWHFQNMYRAMYFRGSVIMSAISAIDIALWDIKGKWLGVPVYELLGGKIRDRVRTYASGFSSQSIEEMVQGVKQLQKDGFNAAKIFLSEPDGDPTGKKEYFSSKIELNLEKVRRCREAVGTDFDLILEIHRSMTLPEALVFANEVKKYRPFALEDPITPDTPDQMGWLAEKIDIPITTGERFINLSEFETLLSRKGALYIRPDVCAVGGITTVKKICGLAEAHNISVIPHNPLGPVSTAACLQICASVSNVAIQELPDFCLNGKEDAMIVDPLQIESGCLVVPDRPGIGIELTEDAQSLFPPKDRATKGAKRSFDGSLLDF